MALKDKPYLPLYTKDFTTDEKLIECTASATGVYIRLMCLMHKSEQYGTVLLGQKDKQSEDQILNFCLKIKKHFPWEMDVIRAGILELLEQKVIQIEGDLLFQKRMVKDNKLSETRAKTGSEGGEKTKRKFAKAKGTGKKRANTDNDIGNESDIKTGNKKSETQKLKIPFTSQLFLDTWYKLIASKKWRKKEDSALQASLDMLARYTEEDAIEMMKNSIVGEWQGLFELKNKNHTNGTKSTNLETISRNAEELQQYTDGLRARAAGES